MKRIYDLLSLDEEAAGEQEVIDGIVGGVYFRGAKLWILVIAVFVASLGLNTNSAAVIIGAMLISPLMGPIIGMGLAIGIYDFDLLRRSARNYIIATIFSILTATFYFLVTPLEGAQSELLARTSPTIYDVLIALCGGLAGIIALGSRSQRTGNVIPGVAIATALMPPLCTVGFGIATANWVYAAGALYLFLINTIFIAFSTLVGTVFIMKFKKKTFIDHKQEVKVKRFIYAITIITIIPAVILTVGMVHKNYFEQHVNQFIRHELHFPLTQVVSHHTDYENRTLSVVMIGNEIDSSAVNTARQRLPLYKLDDVELQVIQGTQSSDQAEAIREMLNNDNLELRRAETIIAQLQNNKSDLERKLAPYVETSDMAPRLLKELKIIIPQVESVTLARGAEAINDSVVEKGIVLVSLSAAISENDKHRVSEWLVERMGDKQLKIIVE
ncbi:MAG: DUF389 domain-containing protein [Bacteroidales bacterium]|nr:DUF389 domain-containing protein [Bacteroidales bacterium]